MPNTTSTSRTSRDGCSDCAVPSARRDFLLTLAMSAAGALVAIGVSPTNARALGMDLTSAAERRGTKASYPVPQADGATIDTANDVILVRFHNAAYAFALSCPHQNSGLKWLSDEARFQCPKHKSRYQPDGAFIEGRATRGMDRYAIRHDGANLVVDLNTLYEQDKDGAGWANARVALS